MQPFAAKGNMIGAAGKTFMRQAAGGGDLWSI
jgi:hypothetical protein